MTNEEIELIDLNQGQPATAGRALTHSMCPTAWRVKSARA